MNKKILVTGGLGHIGSALIRQLPLKYDLTIVDNLSTQRYCSLFNIGRPFSFIEKNFAELTEEELDVHTVVHLGAKTDAASSVSSPAETYYTNVVETKKLIDKIRKVNAKFIFPSSTSVYGTSSEEVFEDYDAYINPQSPYAESKIEVERYIQSNMDNYVIFRFGTIFGVNNSPGCRFHTAIQKFCYQAAFGKKLTIWKDCYEMSRPYLGLNDAVQAIMMAIENEVHYGDGVFNVLTDNFKLSHIVKTIEGCLSKELDIDFVDTPLLNQFSYKVNYDKVKKAGFEPYCDLKQEIEKTLELFS